MMLLYVSPWLSVCFWFIESPLHEFFEQVAERQGKYLASLLNKIGKAGGGHANCAKDMDFGGQFVYRHLGSMATLGRHKALVDLRQSKVTLFILASLSL